MPTKEPTQLTLPDMPKPEHDTGTYTERQIEQGKATYRDASEWRKRNAQAWQFVVQVAKQAAAQRKRIGGRDLIEQVRRKEFTTDSGAPTATNNSFSPVFARWLAIEHPETAPYIERRKTVFDFLVTSYA